MFAVYATHILDNRHENGTAKDTLRLIQPCRKGQHMNSWENSYIQTYQQQGKLITEQQTHDHSPLYELALAPTDIHDSRQLHGTQMGTG